jgi:transketolase
MIKLADEHVLDSIEMRKAFSDAMLIAARENPLIYSVTSDMCNPMGLADFSVQFPNRSINVGIQEANAMGVAAGLAAGGLLPFYSNFACFITRRAYDQAFISCAYAGLNVKIMGGDEGVSAATNGGTHMPLEDMGIMRNIPNIVILNPSDSVMIRDLVFKLASYVGIAYMRFPRREAFTIYENGSSFEIGKANVLREGTDATIIACGIMVMEALKAAKMLQNENISVRVVDMFTIKPIDIACVIESAVKTGAIVTAENHSTINGLGSAVAEVVVENCPIPMERVGVRDAFGQVGPQSFLMEYFGLTAGNICEKVKLAISRKSI